jgi:hypothetical protein
VDKGQGPFPSRQVGNGPARVKHAAVKRHAPDDGSDSPARKKPFVVLHPLLNRASVDGLNDRTCREYMTLLKIQRSSSDRIDHSRSKIWTSIEEQFEGALTQEKLDGLRR